MHERIKKLRKALDLTQREFGERIGVKPNTIATYEIGRNEPIDAVVSLICREFNVNGEWLRTGEGGDAAMFLPNADTALEQLAVDHGLTAGDRALIEKFLDLEAKDRRILVGYVQEVAAAIADQEAATPAVAPSHTSTIEEKARAKAEEYYRQLLLEEEQPDTSSASPSDTGNDGEKMA